MAIEEKRKKVFIQYSWDSPEHQQWVLNLAKDLIEKYNIDIIIDEYDLKAGSDLPHFMEQSIEKADKVLIVLTPDYKVKAEERKNGVGYEATMISHYLFESDITNVKFIPILRKGTAKTSAPTFLKSKIYRNMVDDKLYYSELMKLAKQIYDLPLTVKPEFGAKPNFEEPTIDPIIDSAKALLNKKQLNQELNQIIDTYKGVAIFKNEIEILNIKLKDKVELYRNSSGLNFTYETDDVSTTYIGCEKTTIIFAWDAKFVNTAKEAYLEERRINGIIRKENNRFFTTNNRPVLLRNMEYKFDLDYAKNIVWKCDALKFSSTEIIENAFIFLIGEVSNELSKGFR